MGKTITHLFNHNLVIQRYRTVSGYKKAFQSTATVEGMLQNLSREKAQQLGILTERTYIAYVDISEDVRIGDRISYDDKLYLVKERTKKDYGINTHLELILIDVNE